MAENILGGRLSIEDGYTSPLEKFANSLFGTENKFKQFVNGISNSNNKIASETSKTYQQVDKIAARFLQQGDNVANSINKANDRVRENQEKTIEGLSQKYVKLGMTIQQAYAKAQQESGKIWNGDSPNDNSNGSSGNNDGLKDFAQNFLQSGFGGIIGKLGLIGAGITAGITVVKTLNNWMEQGFNVLNKVSDGLLSPEGIKNAVEESMTFETGRMKLDLFYGSKEKGLQAYQNATNVAQKTYASESDAIDITSKLGQMGITPSQKQLEKLIDVAGTRSEVETSHIGLAVKEAIEGRVMMMQMYGINNKNLKKFYDDSRKSNPTEYKELKGALNKNGTAGNPQKYFNLLTDYIENSSMNGYAETYAQTLQGKLERLSGIWELRKAEIMGINIKDGTSIEGGVFASVGKMVDDLKDKLSDPGTVDSLQKVGKSFGNAFASIGNAFTKAVTPETIDKVADAITKIGDALANMIDKFVSSGQLDKFLKSLPDVVKQVAGNEVIKKKTEAQVGIDLINGNRVLAGFDWVNGQFDRADNLLGFRKPEDIINGDNKPTGGLGYRYNPSQQSTGWAPLGFIKDLMLGDKQMLTDANASTSIDKNKSLSDDEKQSLKDYIKNDNASVYNNVTIGTIQANSYDEILKSIQEAAPNRK